MMAAQRLSIVDLVTPQFLAGLQLPLDFQQYLGILGIDTSETFYTDDTVMYTGIATISTDHLPNSTTELQSNNGSNFSWDTPTIHFRMMVPRSGARFIHDAVTDNNEGNTNLTNAATLLTDLLPTAGVGALDDDDVIVDYPTVSFRIELLIDVLNFTLGSEWKPGMISTADRRVVIDPQRSSERVKISLPKVLLSYEQGDDANDLNPQFNIESWGVTAFDTPQDLGMGELIRMNPPIAVYENEQVAFSIDRVVVDTSADATPPEIMQHFGVDEAWTGIYIGQLLLFYNNEHGVGFNFRVKDALISFSGEVSFEAALDIYLNSTLGILTATPKFYNGSEPVPGLIRGIIDPPVENPPSSPPRGSITVKQGAVMHLEISGGMPPYTVRVLNNGTNLWNTDSRSATFDTVGTHNIFIGVSDTDTGGVGSPLRSAEYLRVIVEAEAEESAPPDGMAADRQPTPDPLQALDPVSITGNQDNRQLTVTENGNTVQLNISGDGDFDVEVRGTRAGNAISQHFTNQPVITLEVPNNSDLEVQLTFAGITRGELDNVPEIRFNFARPLDQQVEAYINYANGNSSLPNSDSHFQRSLQALRTYLGRRPDTERITSVQLDAYASRDSTNAQADRDLSHRRNQVVAGIIGLELPTVPITRADHHGHFNLPHASETLDPQDRDNTNAANRTVQIRLLTSNEPPHEITTNLRRPAYSPEEEVTPPPTTPPSAAPEAPDMPNDIPPVLKQLGIRVKLDRNNLSLLELYGKIDIETELEEQIRSQSGATGSLDMQHGNEHDGVVDFTLTYTYDLATKETGLILAIHSDERDTDGLLHLDNNENRDDRLKNIFGALLLFAPIINASATAVGNDPDDAGAWVGLGASLAVPIAIGGLNVFRTRRIILHGGEARTRWVNPAPGEPLRSFDIGLVFDYEVQFDIICEQLGIGTDRLPGASDPLPPPLKARYKAIGFSINYAKTDDYEGITYTPVFDASKGYDLDLSDPSLFALPDPLGQLLSIAGARLARFNPVTLEVDFAIKVDLGVITVDKFKLKIPLDPTGPPQLLPSSVKVDIPGVIVGNGFVDIVDTSIEVSDDSHLQGGYTQTAKGIEGGLDLTLVSLKIRIVANLGVGTLKDESTGREAISVFIGMAVEFPTPIILGATGLGIYGFMGLFAMHYRRIEAPADPTKAVGPALNWLIKASGEPIRLRTKSPTETEMAPEGHKLWEMAFDRWSFGIGVLLGTAEGGFLVNLQGMLVLELPGPRILIMVKAQIITVLPDNPADPARNLEVGIIGVIDIDFQRKQLTLGVMINFSIEKLLSLTLPIELFFKWDNPSNWHLYLGTIAQPASASILDIVRGSAYLMIQGNELDYSKFGSKVPEFLRSKRLNGIAIATGLEASLTLGSEAIKIYLRIAASAHLGVSFSPFLVAGTMQFSGELRIIIISIGARGTMNVLVSKIPNSNGLKVYIHGEICGSIRLLFFNISACVGLTIGNEEYDVEPPKLVRGVYLQSFSPVLVSGQGSTKPIDASLGTAAEQGSEPLPSDIITVPIDSLPVIQLHATPRLASDFGSQSFVTSPNNISSSNGRITLSDEVEVEYTLNSVTLTEDGSAYDSGAGKPPSVWRIDRPNNGSPTDQAIDLATFSRTPTTAPYAVERSSELNTLVEMRWQNLCKLVAPPAPVLYTMCRQSLGVSHDGWMLVGTPQPDPEGTIRERRQPTLMRAYQQQLSAPFSSLNMFLDGAGLSSCQPAKVVGIEGLNIKLPEEVTRNCFKLTANSTTPQQHPFVIQKELSISTIPNKTSPLTPDIRLIKATTRQSLKDQLQTTFSNIRGGIGMTIQEHMRIDFLQEPVSVAHVRFILDEGNATTNIKGQVRSTIRSASVLTSRLAIPTGKITVEAYNEKGSRLDGVEFTGKGAKGQAHTLTVKGSGIKYLTIRNANYVGILVEVCYERTKRPLLPYPEGYFECMRSLQLPWCSAADQKRMSMYAKQLGNIPVNELQQNDKEKCGLIFETGAFESTLFYGAVWNRARKLIMVQELDDDLTVLAQYSLDSVIIQQVSNPLAELPAEWLDPNLPWRESVLPAVTYLHTAFFADHTRFVAKIGSRSEKTTRIRFLTCGGALGFPSLYISVIQVLPLSEVLHHQHVTESQMTERTIMDGYLNDDTPIPLLKPGKTYRLAVNYTAKVFTRKKPTDSFTEKKSDTDTQTFVFRTDNEPPTPLAPYVLGTTPTMDERFHFYEDPIKVVFNDHAFLRMFDAYGKQLQAIIRAADGQPVENGVAEVTFTGEVASGINSPYREALEKLIAEGKLPCTGAASFLGNPVFEPGFGLKPLMPYTFDIDFNPQDAEGAVKKPLFRQAFITSRYANLEALVADLSQQFIRHKALRNLPVGLPTASGGSTPSVHQLDDVAFENILRQAGYNPSDAPEQTGFTLLWTATATGFGAYALLVDAAEPIWRKTVKAVANTVKNEQLQVIDPNFKIYEQQPVDAMVLLPAAGQNYISHFIRSTGGTRTLVMIRPTAWPTTGANLTIRIAQLEQEFYGLPRKELDLLDITIYPKPPWED